MRRLLPLLLFPVLVSSSCGNEAPGSHTDERGNVRGTVLLGPTCPVETESSLCPDEPLAGVTVKVFDGDLVVATTESDAQGRFTFDLAPGTYVVRAEPDEDQAQTVKPIEVTVVPDRTVEIDLPVDSGIR